MRSQTPGPLRRRDFRLVYLSATISVIGDRFAFVAIPFAVLATSGSLRDIGLIVAAETLARGAFLLVGGVTADRVHRARVMVAADLARAGTQAGMAALIITGRASLALLVALQALHGAASAFFDPASTGLVAEVVPADELQPANAQLSISRGLATFAGPVAAGFLITAFSPGAALAVDAATFVLSGAFLLLISTRERAREERVTGGRMLHDLRVGFRELVVRPWLLLIMGASGVSLMAILGTLVVVGPVVAEQSLGGADAWGLIVGAFGLGSILGGIVALRVPARRQLRSIFAVALVTIPGILLLALPAPNAVLAAAFLLAGIAMSYAGTVYEVVLQQWIPAAVLARIASYDWLVTTVLSSVGIAAAGWAAEAFGVGPTLIGAAAVVTLAAATPLASRAVRRADAWHASLRTERAPGLAEVAEPELEPEVEPEPLIVLPDPPHPVELVFPLADPLPDPPPVWARPD
jgi:MFS family permease